MAFVKRRPLANLHRWKNRRNTKVIKKAANGLLQNFAIVAEEGNTECGLDPDMQKWNVSGCANIS